MDERTLNDLLECSVCLNTLDTTSKVLPCQHTFCRKCLEVIVLSHSELRCPECRVLVDIKIENLPPNVLLMRILEGMKNFTMIPSNGHTETEAITTMNHNHSLVNQSALNSNDVGITATSAREQMFRTMPLNSDTTQRIELRTVVGASATVNANKNALNVTPSAAAAAATTAPVTSSYGTTNIKSNDDSQMAVRSKQPSARQPSQNVLAANLIGHQNTGTGPSMPHAKALYDFESKEPGDLNFQKGDKILLRRRIDVNWFVGECNGRDGVFPINYVQIVVPLAQPQCKALYDFRMGPNEEEGCLTFKKGAIINVLRRVDQNWAEGRIDDTIGIFPIAFVEMNVLAKHIMDASAKYMHYAMAQRNVPPTPNDQQHSSFSSGSSSLTTSPVSPNSSGTSTTSTGPSHSLKTNQPNGTQNIAMLTSAVSGNSKRGTSSNASTAGHASQNGSSQPLNTRHSKDMQSNEKAKVPAQKHSKPYNSMNKGGSNRANQRQRQNTQNIAIPSNAFVALFPYKPQKTDELELKKGSIYYVKERCQDGWFRGVNRSQKTGVFPGNYVAPLRTINEQSNGSTATGTSASGMVCHSKRSAALISGAPLSALKSTNGMPPELPPRSSVSSSSTASSSSSSSVWSKPIGQHVEALFGRSQSSSTVNLIKRITNIKRSKSPSNQTATAYSMDNPVFEDNTIGSTTNDQTNNLQSVTSAFKRNSIHMSHPQHVRSGSCPSQLLQSLPVDINASSSAGINSVLSKADMFGSHRIRSHKERAALQQLTHGFGAPNQGKTNEPMTVATATTTTTVTPYHRKSQSLDASTIAAQLKNCSTDAENVNKRKSYTHNEKFKCIVSYPPNSDYELELAVGDIVYVHKKRDNGWYKGTHAQTGKVGLFPSSFVEPVI